MKDRKKYIIKKLPTAIFMWFTVFFAIISLQNLLGKGSMEGLWPLLWVIIIIGAPIAVPVIFLRTEFENVPYIQKWWVWLIGMLCSFLLIGVTEPPAQPEDQIATIPTEITEAATEVSTESTTEVIEITESTTSSTEPLSMEELFVEDFASHSGMETETARTIYSLLHNEMHFENIKFSGKNKVGQINWDILADDYKIMLTADDEGIYRALCGNLVLYENSHVVMTKENIESMDASKNAPLYYVIAKEIVTNQLKSPSSAKFCSMQNCAMQRNGDIAAVKGYVEAKNALGVMIRNEFLVQFQVVDADTYSYNVLYVAIGDQSAGKFIDMN